MRAGLRQLHLNDLPGDEVGGEHEDDEHTNMMSTNGVTLMSVMSPPAAGRWQPITFPRWRRRNGTLSLDVGENAMAEGAARCQRSFHVAHEHVVGGDRGNCDQQAHRRGDQRLGDAGHHRLRPKAALLLAKIVERAHDAQHRAEQPDKGACCPGCRDRPDPSRSEYAAIPSPPPPVPRWPPALRSRVRDKPAPLPHLANARPQRLERGLRADARRAANISAICRRGRRSRRKNHKRSSTTAPAAMLRPMSKPEHPSASPRAA